MTAQLGFVRRPISSGELRHLPPRIAEPLGLNDFHVLHVKRIESGPKIGAGLSFLEFRKRYKRPTVIYSCPCCGDGDAVESQELLLSQFEKIGGEVVPLGNLALKR
jgi:hypothetical protein